MNPELSGLLMHGLRGLNVQALDENGTVRQLADWLSGRGVDAAAQCYPLSRQRCDLVLSLPSKQECWIEVKLAWRAWPGAEWNGFFWKHMFSLADGENSVRRDIVEKLPGIRRSGDYLGFLLIGFDSFRQPMDGDIAELIFLTGMEQQPWECSYADWRHPDDAKYRIRCWLWYRQIPTMAVC